MAIGTITTLGQKGFGSIEMPNGMEILFAISDLVDMRPEDLRQGQKVTFEESHTPKGPRAERVALA